MGPSGQTWANRKGYDVVLVAFAAILFLQAWKLQVMVWDELPVKLDGDEERVWWCFYRRCGIMQRDFKQVTGNILLAYCIIPSSSWASAQDLHLGANMPIGMGPCTKHTC